MPKLHANGLAALHIGDKQLTAGKDGMIDVPVEHLADALSHGCTHEPKTAPSPVLDLAARVAAIEARLDAIEARDASPKKGG